MVCKVSLFLISLFITAEGSAQTNTLNRHGRISKSEFKELLKHRDNFIPPGIFDDTIIVVRYTALRLAQLQRSARNVEFARNGEDTTGYTDEALFGKQQVEQMSDYLSKLSRSFPEEQAKALGKKGIVTLIVDENIAEIKYRNKIWLITDFVCSQKRFRGAWVSSIRTGFFDPTSGKLYDVFRPMNYDALDLLDIKSYSKSGE